MTFKYIIVLVIIIYPSFLPSFHEIINIEVVSLSFSFLL